MLLELQRISAERQNLLKTEKVDTTGPHRFRQMVLVVLGRSAVYGIGAGMLLMASAVAATNHRQVFDMDGRQIIQDEAHLGILNGKLTAGINYRRVGSIGGLWSPPFVSSNFMLDGRVNGEVVPTTNWTWRPFQVERHGKVGNVDVSGATSMIYGDRALVESLTFRNTGREEADLDLLTLGWLDEVADWGFARPSSTTEARPQVEGQRLILRQGSMVIVIGIDAENWRWEVSGNLGHATARLPGRRTCSVNVAVAIGQLEEASASVNMILVNPSNSIATSRKEYDQQVEGIFERLPILKSDNAQLVRWYQRSLIHLLMSRWDAPQFALHPYYSTGSVNGGCLANYLWNFGEGWEIFPLFDPQAAKSHIKQFLRCNLLERFYFTPISGTAGGVWYMINQEKIIGLTYFYVLLTGDTAFLDETVDGKIIRDHMVIQAMFGDDATKPMNLIDYGPSGSHLELRRHYGYNHIMPDLNARRYASYLRAATLCELAGKPAEYLRGRAQQLRPLLKKRLWDPESRWFFFEDEKGRREPRYTVQMFKPIGSGVLDRECEDGLLSHLNEFEFLSPFGLHSISKRDPAFDQLDIDNGGGGICTSFPPQIIERLYQARRPDLAADILKRLLWWADAMPYWGDSIAANCKDYRRDTPLQCTFDGVAAAQCIIFGVFGVNVRPDGDIAINPNSLPFARRLELKGLKVRGKTIDTRIDGQEYEVRCGAQKLHGKVGTETIVSAKDGSLRHGR